MYVVIRFKQSEKTIYQTQTGTSKLVPVQIVRVSVQFHISEITT